LTTQAVVIKWWFDWAAISAALYRLHPEHGGMAFEVGFPSQQQRASMTEKHYRSVVKAISWRATGTVDTILISFLITGHASLALKIGFVELFTKIALYYVHERVWNKLSFGRVKAKEEYSI
jgi:uncharacterized membrane protein